MVNKILNNSMMSEDSVWIMYNSENCDPYFSKFITNKTVVSTICILSNNKKNLNQKFLLVHSLDKDNISNFDGEVIVYNGENSLVHNMTEILKKLDYPKIIYLNYSDKMDVLIDILGYGTYRFLTDNIILEYKKANKSPIFKSSDELIYFLLDTKTEEDIFYMKIAAKRALDILTRSFNSIKIGMTEKQIQNLVHKISSFRHSYNNSNIISEDFSWEKELCPIVLTGTNLAKGGHSCPDDRTLKPGDTIYMDFGIQIHLRDGRKYSSDI
ncbi:MAG: M24 family metallopeptidase [Clostridia bacterium]|nr:M24 family metallopeptidase [Clostridia bacterium]